MKQLGPLFRDLAGPISETVSLSDPEMVERAIRDEDPVIIEIDGTEFEVPSTAITLIETVEKIHTESFTPNVIEPSFGIDRIMTAVLEHAYHEASSSPKKVVEEGTYHVLRLLPSIAPIKFGVFPLLNKEGMVDLARDVDHDLRGSGITTYYDPSGSIGRKYARMDEIGTPFCITVDHRSLHDRTVTIRERDTGEQIRITMDYLVSVCRKLVVDDIEFSELSK